MANLFFAHLPKQAGSVANAMTHRSSFAAGQKHDWPPLNTDKKELGRIAVHRRPI
jgi:hypothetical protein